MILKRILEEKAREVAQAKRRVPVVTLLARIRRMPPPRPFLAKLNRKKIAVIAEIKRRSPSRGLIRRDFRPLWIARRYQSAGAAALSVLTDRRFFGGSPDILRRVRRATRLPVLRKDFLIDEYQIYESRAMGADAVLLIAAALPAEKLARLAATARRLRLAVLFEVHDAAEWAKVRALRPRLVGVNNRNLKSFQVDLKITERLARRISKDVEAQNFAPLLVAESGIHGHADLARMKKAGAKAVLVGEGLMKHADPGMALKNLLEG